MVGQVAVVPDRVEEKLLLQEAETVVIGLAGTVDEVVLSDECTVGLEIGVVQSQDRRLGMGLDVVGGGVSLLHAGDAHAAPGPDHVLHEEGHLAHHRPPAGLVPAHGAIGKRHLQLAVVVHPGHQFLGEPRADGADADRS